MWLKNFRIRNYKSLQDSSLCWLASDITILAGKNESGKTAILEALRDFDRRKSIPEAAYPLDNDMRPLLELCFDINREELIVLCQKIGLTYVEQLLPYISGNGVTFIKDHHGNYGLADELKNQIHAAEFIANQPHLTSIAAASTTVSGDNRFPEIPLPDTSGTPAEVKNDCQRFVAAVTAQLSTLPANREMVEGQLKLIESESKKMLSGSDQVFWEQVLNQLPEIILFSDFIDLLPSHVPFATMKDSSSVVAFAKIAGLDLDQLIRTADVHRRKNLLRKHSAFITGDFREHWNQSQLEIVADSDGDNLFFYVRDAGSTTLYSVDQRSKGFQWFLSFYLALGAREGNTGLILIDEPGLYVHAKAQQDILNVLEDRSSTSQIIISTHSPYLIDAAHLNRVKLVIKGQEGTKIEKIQKTADVDTLTPIRTAIGLDLANDFSNFGKCNVLLEGISDYYYLQKLAPACLPKEYCEDVKIIGCVGATKIDLLVSIMIGWGLEFIVILDNDQRGHKTRRDLIRSSIDDRRIIYVTDVIGGAVEDVLTREEFNQYVLEEEQINPDPDVPNSRFVKEQKLDKAVLAKNFFERKDIPEGLSPETCGRFEMLFKQVIQIFTD